jgi:hypothetical protein
MKTKRFEQSLGMFHVKLHISPDMEHGTLFHVLDRNQVLRPIMLARRKSNCLPWANMSVGKRRLAKTEEGNSLCKRESR